MCKVDAGGCSSEFDIDMEKGVSKPDIRNKRIDIDTTQDVDADLVSHDHYHDTIDCIVGLYNWDEGALF